MPAPARGMRFYLRGRVARSFAAMIGASAPFVAYPVTALNSQAGSGRLNR
jgi:hypothetical protein